MRELALHVLPSGGMRDESDIEHIPARTTSIIPNLVYKPRDTELPYSEQTFASPRDGPSEVFYTGAIKATHPNVQGTPDFHIPGAYPENPLSAQEYLLSRTFSSERDVFIAVMGPHYSGKSTFIRTCVNGSKGAQTFHSMSDCVHRGDRILMEVVSPQGTDQVSISTFEHGQQVVHLIDTPTFGSIDEGSPDIDFLKDIAFWLGKSYDAQVLLNGIIYLHPITFSISESMKARFKLFKALCGEASLPSVVLVTTMWDPLGNTEEGMRRHVELIKGPYFWWEMIAGGSRTWRYLGHKDSAIKILSYLCEKKEKTVLAIQRQLIESGDLSKTNAGGELLHEISQRIAAYEKSINSLEGQMKRALKDNDQQQCADLAAVRDSHLSKVNAAIVARDGLTISLLNLYRQKGAEDAIAEILRKRGTDQQGVETVKRDIYEAQQYEERAEREEMSDHDSQAAEHEATQAIGKGRGILVKEAGLISEGLEQHPLKREYLQALKSEALERARLAQLQEQEWKRYMEQLQEARRARVELEREIKQLQEAALVERRALYETRPVEVGKGETRRAQVELEKEIKQLQEAVQVEYGTLNETRLVGVGGEEGQPTPSITVYAAAAAAAVVAATTMCIIM